MGVLLLRRTATHPGGHRRLSDQAVRGRLRLGCDRSGSPWLLGDEELYDRQSGWVSAAERVAVRPSMRGEEEGAAGGLLPESRWR